uniref:BED-type domain-containing protein n=1 Tax=Salix viminalis TaxID=40686 RepID=A0A6N2MWB4_SALVM
MVMGELACLSVYLISNMKAKWLACIYLDYMASKKTTSGNRLDVGKQHGIDIENTSRKVQCKYCQKIFSGGIYRFKHHLACTRKDVEPCHQVPADVKQMMLNVSGEDADEDFEISSMNKGKKPISGSGSTQMTINQMLKKDIREEACQQIARFFYTSAIPFNCARNPEFVKALELVAKHGPGLAPLTMILERNTSHISKTTFKVFEMLDAIVERIEEGNVVQVITDNAANYKAAGHLLMEKRKTLYWTPCSAHCIDLILEDFEKKLELHALTIGKGRRITTYIYSRSLLISMLRKFTKGQDLIRPGATRFATAYLTLGCLNNCKITLMSMFTSVQWRSSRYSKSEEGRQIQNCVLDSNFWHDVSECIKAAFPLIKVLRLVDSDEIPAMVERDKIDLQLNIFSEAKGLFGIEAAKKARDKKTPARWWDSYGDEYDLPSDDEWVTEGEGHGGSSNINLLQTIDSATRRHEDDSDEDNFNSVEMSTEATEDYFETLHSRSLELNNVGTGSTSNLFHCDAIDAILGHSEGGESETEAGFSLHYTPAEDLF